jgi:hypothetical protein
MYIGEIILLRNFKKATIVNKNKSGKFIAKYYDSDDHNKLKHMIVTEDDIMSEEEYDRIYFIISIFRNRF